MKLKSIAITNVGRVRDNNEDNYYLCGKYKENTEETNREHSYAGNSDAFLAGVCDGMGGMQFGEVASMIAIKTLTQYAAEFDEEYEEYFEEANALICNEINARDGKRLGTTAVVLSIRNNEAYVYNIGDSRAYVFRNEKLTQLSEDHTQVQMLIREGIVTEEEAKTHKSKHVLTQHLGIFPDEMIIEPQVTEPMELKVGDVILLCSDGLTDMVSDEEIEQILEPDREIKEVAEELIERALDHGGKDNTTVLMVKIYAEEEPKTKKEKTREVLNSKFPTASAELIEKMLATIEEKQN